ncbi:uncharacterized protein LY79DRAFT_129688 [Colletotrichum navitas]|uniref:Zn(2)-C6 fungal-type domain-containing protein n=1 Tax=Colletotrichum navitas TaxID=681940 RepID=A0AAD8UYB8_9PEZI|nr:uncharacterized protein LY79DRAFT_129688 [Colletotrichum navitas]KAK1565895.1 hypothetical protein LY79DRAFT_129688 [Colletotrichum navitas]
MKPKRSCESCRKRHRKCIIRPGATRCSGCDETDKECTLSPSFQFRPSKFSDITRVDWGGKSPEEHGASPGPGPGPDPDPDPDPDPETQSQTSLTSGRESVPLTDAAVEARDSIAPWSPASARTSGELTQREAFLYRMWVQKIALISDALDDERHFAVTVSRLALEHDVLLNGILGLASRFDRLANGPSGTSADIESAFYHGRCMELLIGLLNKPAETYDATLLAAVVLSRLYEENDTETDSLTYHLNGTSTLLGQEVITRLATKGGLAEAACWVHLRQAIYIAIVHRQHLNIPLRVYENLTAFRKADDTSYANRVVYLLARIVLHYFPQQPINVGSSPPDDDWKILQEELDMWFTLKPVSFNPIYYEPPDANGGEPFPRMWMASTLATVALQHYYSGQIIVNLHQSNNPLSTGFEATKAIRTNEKFIASSLCVLMGLALSNEQALNAWYLPCHMLQLCGYVLRNRMEREHTIQYLETVKKQIQWKTAPLIAVLTRQWAELDGYEIEER